MEWACTASGALRAAPSRQNPTGAAGKKAQAQFVEQLVEGNSQLRV